MLCACDGSGGRTPTVVPQEDRPFVATTVVGEGGDALALELLLAGASPDAPHWHPHVAPSIDATLAAALDAIARDHVRSCVFDAGSGPPLLASATMRRLAQEPFAPPDANGSGSNLDETLQAEVRRVLTAAAADLDDDAASRLPALPFRQRSAELLEPLRANAWRTRDLGDRSVLLRDVADAIGLRAAAARRLLTARRRSWFGADADAGRVGLLALLSALAAEETLFTELFVRGAAPGPLPTPRTYDPQNGAAWLPAEVAAEVGATATGWRTIDPASELTTLASLLRAGRELSALGDEQGSAQLPFLFRGRPFRTPPPTPTPPSISWAADIAPLLTQRCGSCHLTQTRGGFSIVSYESMLLGGNNTRALQLPFLVPGNASASVLYQVLSGPPAPFVPMPFGGPPLPPAEIERIAAWIDGGALRDPLAAPPAPRPGHDLLEVSFRNLVALHFEADSGALHHRREPDGVSGIATAHATGQALLALAALSTMQPGPAYGTHRPDTVLASAARFAAARFVAADGSIADEFDVTADAARGDADLAAHASLTAGLLAAATALSTEPGVTLAAVRARDRLLTAFRAPDSPWFVQRPGERPSVYRAAQLADLLTALRLAAAEPERTALLRELRAVLTFAEWPGHGEIAGDGIADTDGNGLREPALAGGAFGTLPLLTEHIVIDATAPLTFPPLTWSRDVRPLLVGKCGECHMNGNERGDYRLDTRRSLAVPGESAGLLPLLVPGDADASFLVQKISLRQPAVGERMPLQRPPLDAAGITRIRQWILQGATSR